MAHFAQVENGTVVTVVVVPDAHEHDGEAYLNDLGLEGRWIQTSYNTYGGVHNGGGVPLRYNFAGIGFTYDPVRDAFIAPEPAPSEDGTWVLDDATLLWTLAPNEDF